MGMFVTCSIRLLSSTWHPCTFQTGSGTRSRCSGKLTNSSSVWGTEDGKCLVILPSSNPSFNWIVSAVLIICRTKSWLVVYKVCKVTVLYRIEWNKLNLWIPGFVHDKKASGSWNGDNIWSKLVMIWPLVGY